MSDIQAIKDRLDIVDVIGEYVSLKPAGTNMKGLCPFHNEKSPSFMVNRERQTFKCFGCSKGGDVFTFIQEIEGMEFVETLKLLASKAGVTLTQHSTSDVDSNQKNRLKAINQEAARFYHKFLTELPAAQEARAYLEQRAITSQTIETWQIGYIPDQWDLLTKYLIKKGYSIDDLIVAGITIKKEQGTTSGKGYYDRFRGRIMFPLCDIHGTVVGFTGRVLKETEYSGGKYVNTPQTPVYDKSRVVFGLDKARQSIRKQAYVVMVEGQMDVIACHQAGMINVVATSGTALTEHQVTLLARYTKEMRIAFDADDAGQAAAKRGIDIALQAGMHVRIITIKEGCGKDPDECIKQNKDIWWQCVDAARDVMTWYLEKAQKGKDKTNPHDKQKIADEVLPEIARIPYAVEKDHWLQELSRCIQVDVPILREDLARIVAKQSQDTAKTYIAHQDKEAAISVDKNVQNAIPQTKMAVILEKWLGFGLRFPTIWASYYHLLPEEALKETGYGPLYEQIKKQYTETNALSVPLLSVTIQQHEEQNRIDILLMKSEWEFSHIDEARAQAEIMMLTEQLNLEWKKEKRKLLEHQIREAEAVHDHARVAQLIEEFQKVL